MKTNLFTKHLVQWNHIPYTYTTYSSVLALLQLKALYSYFSTLNTYCSGFTCCMPIVFSTLHSRAFKSLCKCLKSLILWTSNIIHHHQNLIELRADTFLYWSLGLVDQRLYENSSLHSTLALENSPAVRKHFPAPNTFSGKFTSCVQILFVHNLRSCGLKVCSQIVPLLKNLPCWNCSLYAIIQDLEL